MIIFKHVFSCQFLKILSLNQKAGQKYKQLLQEKLMSLKVEFPKKEYANPSHQLTISSYQKVEKFHEQIADICYKTFQSQDLFAFKQSKIIDKYHLFKCNLIGICFAYLLYQPMPKTDIYVLKQYNLIHIHGVSHFNRIEPKFIIAQIPPPKKFTFPKKIEKYQKVQCSRKNIKQLIQQLKEDSNKKQLYLKDFCLLKYDQQTVRLGCFPSQKFLSMSCQWKMIYRKKFIPNQPTKLISQDLDIKSENNQGKYYFCLDMKTVEFDHCHYYLTSYQRQVQNQKIIDNMKTNFGKSIIFDNITFDDYCINESSVSSTLTYRLPTLKCLNIGDQAEVSNFMKDLFQPSEKKGYDLNKILQQYQTTVKCLQKPLHQLYAKIFQNKTDKIELKYFNEEQKSYQKNKIRQHIIEDRRNKQDFDDILILTSLHMRFLSRNYGTTVVITKIKKQFTFSVNKQQKVKQTLTFFLFSGFNFSQRSLLFCTAYCRNSTLQKLFKLFYIIIQYQFKNLVTIITDEQNAEQIFVLRNLQLQVHKKFNLVGLPKNSLYWNYQIGFSCQLQIRKYHYYPKVKGKLTRPKLYAPYQGKLIEHSYSKNQKQYCKDLNKKQTDIYDLKFKGSLNLKYALSIRHQIKKLWKQGQLRLQAPCYFGDCLSELMKYSGFNYCTKSLMKKMMQKNQRWAIHKKKEAFVQNYFDSHGVASCRQMMSINNFNTLSHQLNSSLACSILSQQQQFFLIEDDISILIVERTKFNKKPEKQYRFNNRNHQGNLWAYLKQLNQKTDYRYKCECGFEIRLGMPCRHLLKIIFHLSLNLLDYIEIQKVIDLGIYQERRIFQKKV